MSHIFFTQPWQVIVVGTIGLAGISLVLMCIAGALCDRLERKIQSESRCYTYETQQQRKRSEALRNEERL